VQKFSNKDYTFRHHLETTVESAKEVQGVAWKRVTSFAIMDKIVKVRVNHIGQIVKVGEY
jgi:CRISPR-associated endonuclease Csn1